MSPEVLQLHGAAKDTPGGSCCSCGGREETGTTSTRNVSEQEKEEENPEHGQSSEEQSEHSNPRVTQSEDRPEGNADVTMEQHQETTVMEGDSDTETELEPDTAHGTSHAPASPSSPGTEAQALRLDSDTDVDVDVTMSGIGDEYQDDDWPLEADDEPLEVDDNAQDDLLSIYPMPQYLLQNFDTVQSNSSTRSLYDGTIDYVYENGRRYVRGCIMPSDDTEQDRQNCMHQVFVHLFNRRPTSVELDDPTFILDIGTGTGEWAMEIAQLYPDCEVMGIDIDRCMETRVPHNVRFEVDDCEVAWDKPPTDLVHIRNMAGLIDDWPFIYNQAYTCLKPGGYIELLDFFNPREAAPEWNTHFPPDSPMYRLLHAIDKIRRVTGRYFGADHLSADLLSAAGFVDIEITEATMPFNHEENLGVLWAIVTLTWLEAAYLRLLTNVLGWDPREAMGVIDSVNHEMRNMMMNPEARRDFAVRFRRAKARKPPDAPWPLPHSAVASNIDEDECG